MELTKSRTTIITGREAIYAHLERRNEHFRHETTKSDEQAVSLTTGVPSQYIHGVLLTNMHNNN